MSGTLRVQKWNRLRGNLQHRYAALRDIPFLMAGLPYFCLKMLF